MLAVARHTPKVPRKQPPQSSVVYGREVTATVQNLQTLILQIDPSEKIPRSILNNLQINSDVYEILDAAKRKRITLDSIQDVLGAQLAQAKGGSNAPDNMRDNIHNTNLCLKLVNNAIKRDALIDKGLAALKADIHMERGEFIKLMQADGISLESIRERLNERKKVSDESMQLRLETALTYVLI